MVIIGSIVGAVVLMYMVVNALIYVFNLLDQGGEDE
jgi:hypothetical protein